LLARPLAAKQEAFEESIRLKNQFRALDEDEVEFLDSMLESTRAEEERVRRETAEGLETFRRQQEDADKRLLADAANTAVVNPDAAQEDWVAAGARKRKRKAKEKEVLVKGVKLRTSSTSGSIAAVSTPEMPSSPSEVVRDKDVSPIAVKSISMMSNTSYEEAQPSKLALVVTPTIRATDSTVPKGGLCLVDYGSDEE
jgi:hypothetical protein